MVYEKGHGLGNNEGKGSDNKGPGHDNQITLEVATPNGVFRGTFEKTAKVEEVIAAIIADRHLAAGDAFELHYGETILQPVQRPLVSFGLSGTVKLTLVATGSGVEMPTVAELCVDVEFGALEENARLMRWKLERTSPTSFILGLPASDGSWFWLNCIAERYAAEPPAWHWYDPETKKLDDLKDTPKEVGFFHSNGVICAPWNRLAYKAVDSRGPHDNWQIGDWRKNPENGACRTLSAMAIRIARELRANLKGRKAA